MRTLVSIAFVAVVSGALAVQTQPQASLAQILTFETDHPGGAPAGWTSGPPGAATVDAKVVHGGKWSARVDKPAGSPGPFNGLSQVLPLDVNGKSIAVRAFLRTADVTESVALWVRVDGESGSLAFDTTQNRQVKGTNDWQEHSVTVPLTPEGRRLWIGVLVSGTGTLWVDDVELLVDGVPIWQAPKLERPKTVLDTDKEFDQGSRITLETLSAAQIDNLALLGKVWGFLKYHHPAVTSGSRHWDYDLFRVLPSVLAATDRVTANAAVAKWVAGLGSVSPCTQCVTLKTETLHLSPNVQWIQDETRLGRDLSGQLRAIHTNRRTDAKQFYVSLAPSIGNPVFANEPAYAVRLPDAGYQLLAVYRFWNIIEYWFPYRDVIGEDWDGVLREFIPKVASARAVDSYQRELIALIARVHDTHANLWSSLGARPPVGACRIPVTIRFVDGRPVVTHGSGGLNRGDILTAIDGAPIARLVDEWSPYYAASNVPTRLRDIARFMTQGSCGESSIGVMRGSEALTVKAARVPTEPPTSPPTHDLPGATFRKLSDEVAYLKLSTIKAEEVAGFLKSAAGTKGLVIDIRNYPSAFVVFALGQLLVSEPTTFARFTQGDITTPGAFHWGPEVTLRPVAPQYTGKVVILIDEISQSQSEYTAMALRASPNARIVGSTTAGADGNVTPIPLPGGLRSMISGIGVFYPDKRPTQRTGIIPDVEVRPTIDGIRDGRDEVLEAALREILGPTVSIEAIRKMISGS